MYDFEFVNSNSEFDKAMRCQSELMFVGDGGGRTSVCLVGGGDSPVACAWPDGVHIPYPSNTRRGWSSRRANEDGRRVHYLWRRSQT